MFIKSFPKRGYTCDLCSKEIAMYSNVYQCREDLCQFDSCGKCATGARRINQVN